MQSGFIEISDNKLDDGSDEVMEEGGVENVVDETVSILQTVEPTNISSARILGESNESEAADE